MKLTIDLDLPKAIREYSANKLFSDICDQNKELQSPLSLTLTPSNIHFISRFMPHIVALFACYIFRYIREYLYPTITALLFGKYDLIWSHGLSTQCLYVQFARIALFIDDGIVLDDERSKYINTLSNVYDCFRSSPSFDNLVTLFRYHKTEDLVADLGWSSHGEIVNAVVGDEAYVDGRILRPNAESLAGELWDAYDSIRQAFVGYNGTFPSKENN